METEKANTLVEDVAGFLQVYADGFVSRFDHGLTAASAEVKDGAASMDALINPSTGLWARLFLPLVEPYQKLPLLLYFHGGGFCIGSTAWRGFHLFLTGLAARARVMVVSVDYRLAPEHRLPTAYDDCLEALTWTLRADHDHPWLRCHADRSSCFLGGESAGGNIAHNVGVRAAGRGVSLRGLVVIHPYFGSHHRIPCEEAAAAEVGGEKAVALDYNDLFWRLALPEGCDRDYAMCNPEAADAPDLKAVPLPPVLVAVAGLDLLKTRGLLYFHLLKRCGKHVELIEAEDQIHAYHVFHPLSQPTRLLHDRISLFIQTHRSP